MVYGYAIITDCDKREEVEKELLDAGADKARADVYSKRGVLPYRDKVVEGLGEGDIFLAECLENIAISDGDLADLIEAIEARGASLKIVDEVAPFSVKDENAKFYLSALVDYIRVGAKKRGKAISNGKTKKKGVEK